MEETNWSSDFYSDIFSLDFDSVFDTIDLESLGSKENSHTVIFLLWDLFLTLINIPRLRFSHFVIGTINWK